MRHWLDLNSMALFSQWLLGLVGGDGVVRCLPYVERERDGVAIHGNRDD